jgi:hypothetical protein
MRTHRTSIDYHLVFASRHRLGLEKMKEAMKRVGQNGTYSFSSDSVGQQQIRFDDTRGAALAMLEAFSGRSVTYAELHDYALNESPFVNPKSMLKLLESEQLISVQCVDAARRRGTYPDHMHGSMKTTFTRRGANG